MTYNERETKTRQGDDVSDVNESSRVFQDPDGGKYCPVSIYEMYARKRPQDACNPTSRFYLQPKKNQTSQIRDKQPVWYKSAPNRVNSLKGYMKKILIKADRPTDVRLSNISVRKHLVSTCKRAGVLDSTTIKVYILIKIK